MRTWEDQLAGAIKAQGERAHGLLPKYSDAFSASYADTFLPERALEDIKRMERLGPDRQMAVDFIVRPTRRSAACMPRCFGSGADPTV